LSLRLSAPAFNEASACRSAVYLVESTVYGTNTTKNTIGQITQLRDQSGITIFDDYDFKGNLLSSLVQLCQDYKNTISWDIEPPLEAETYDTEFTYDAMNRPVEITKPDSSVEQYGYNKAGLLETVKARLRGSVSWTDFVRDINYNEKGQRTEVYFANDSKTAYTYDDKTFRLTRLLTTRYKGQDVLQDLNYEYDPVGNITRLRDDAQQSFYFDNTVIAPESRFTYDALYRLTEATGREIKALAMPTHNDFANNIALPNPASNAMQNYTQQYTYDALGNIQRMQSKGYWTRDYFYNPGVNSLKGHTSGVTAYTYDEHGNTTAMPHLSRIKWDYADRLQYADLGGGGNAYYVYDTNGERVRKVIEKGTVVEERMYLGSWEMYRKHISGNLNFERETLHISDNTKKIASVETKTVENGMDVLSHPAIRYQYDNHLGSACLELDENAAIISYEEYHPFGTTSYRSGPSETEVSLKRYKYVGKERDEETGLYFYGARYYAGWLGRFVSVDALAVEFPQFSPYVYSNDNPLRYSDPTGMQSEDEVDQVHPPTKPETKWNYSKELTESWYPDRQDLSIYTSDEFTILKQDVSTHDDLHATDYYYLNEDNWKPFEPAKSTFKEDVEKFALYPILFSGGAVAGSILIESLVPLAVEGVKASVPYLAKGALVAAEEAGLAYEAAQGIVATYPKLTGVILEIAGAELSGVDPIPNPLSSAYSEAFKFALFSYSHRHELIKNGKEVLKNDFQFSNSKNTSNLQMMPADNTRFVKPTIPYEIEKLDKKSIR
jgi:RHS repeat-associated protein